MVSYILCRKRHGSRKCSYVGVAYQIKKPGAATERRRRAGFPRGAGSTVIKVSKKIFRRGFFALFLPLHTVDDDLQPVLLLLQVDRGELNLAKEELPLRAIRSGVRKVPIKQRNKGNRDVSTQTLPKKASLGP